MGPHPAVAAIRLAVRRVLHDILDEHTRNPGEHGRPSDGPGRIPDAPREREPSPLVLVACSGGADSMALASALAFEAPASVCARAVSPSTTASRPAPTCGPPK